jgi:Mn-dependent DtxR family transcriptional regulator
MDLKNQIIKLLTESEPLRSGKITEILDADRKEVDKILKELKKEEIVISPKRCFVSIKK